MRFLGLLLPLLANGKGSGPALDLTAPSNGFAPVSMDGVHWYNGDYTWGQYAQNHTWAPWVESYLSSMSGADVAWAKSMIDLAAIKGTSGLRIFTAAYDQASFEQQSMCHQATGDIFHLESLLGTGIGPNWFPKLQWQVKELALMVRFGLASPDTFKTWAEKLGTCAGFIPGQDNYNFKQIISRDLAIFEAAATTPVPVASGAAVSDTFKMAQTVDFGNAAATAGDWVSNEAFNHAAVVYDRLFTGANFADHAAGAEATLQTSYGSYNCPDGAGATAILSVADFKDAEKYAFQLAMAGVSGGCADKTTFEKIATAESAVTEGFTSAQISDRQFAYMRAVNAINTKHAVTTMEWYENMNTWIAIFGVLSVVSFALTGGQRQMLDKRN